MLYKITNSCSNAKSVVTNSLLYNKTDYIFVTKLFIGRITAQMLHRIKELCINLTHCVCAGNIHFIAKDGHRRTTHTFIYEAHKTPRMHKHKQTK